MSDDRPYMNMEAEKLLNTPEVKALQLKKVQKLVERLYHTKPFWRGRLDEAGVKPEDIKSLDDYAKRVPVFDKAQRRKLYEDCGGDMIEVVDRVIGVSSDRICLMGATSGTTGEPTPYPLTRYDIQWCSENIGRMAWRIGLRPGDRMIHAFGLSMYLAGVPYAEFFQNSGPCVYPVGAESGAERILKFADMFKATAMACTPSLAEHLIDKAPDVIGRPVGDLSIRVLFCGGEPGAGIPEVRHKLESAYGARLFDSGAGFGISCDHGEYQGMHHVADDSMLFELVDPDTYEPLPFVQGMRGMPVQTTLEGEGFLWFRETIGDVCEIYTDPCPCGRTGFRYKVVGRTDDMLKIKGVIVYPAAIDGVVTGFVPRVTGEFRIILDEPPPRVVPPLKLKIEYGQGVSQEQLPELEKEILQVMKQRLNISPKITWLPPQTLERSTYKTNFIEKAYEKK